MQVSAECLNLLLCGLLFMGYGFALSSADCGRNEWLNKCGNHCELECGSRLKICTFDCRAAACACKPNYYRHPNGKCVTELQCRRQSKDCGENEILNQCGNHCDLKCGETLTICTADCRPPACACAPGYVRHPNGKCVKQERCPMPTGACTKANRVIASALPMPGAFMFQCNAYGFYELIQCHASSGYCWCVDAIVGAKIEGTEKPPGTGPPMCSDCHKKLAEIAQLGVPPGVEIPICAQ